MPETNRSLIEQGGTLSLTLHGRNIDLYRLTKQEINSLGINTVFREIFLTLAALLGGAFLNILLVMSNKNLPEETIIQLATLKWVCLAGCGLFFLLFVALCVLRFIDSLQFTKPQKVEVESDILS